MACRRASACSSELGNGLHFIFNRASNTVLSRVASGMFSNKLTQIRFGEEGLLDRLKRGLSIYTQIILYFYLENNSYYTKIPSKRGF